MELSKQLKSARTDASLSQEELAKKIYTYFKEQL